MAIIFKEGFNSKLDQKTRFNMLTGMLDKSEQLGTLNWLDSKTVRIPNMEVSGLFNYTNGGSVTTGSIDTTSDTYTLQAKRSVSLPLNIIDMDESGQVLTMQNVMETFITEKVTPEIDAYRFKQIFAHVTASGEASQITEETITETNVYSRITDDVNAVLNREGAKTEGDLLIFASYEVKALLEQKNNNRALPVVGTFEGKINSKVYDFNGSMIVYVPGSRFYTDIDLLNTGNGGYAKSATGKDINYAIVNTSSVLGLVKTQMPKVVDYTQRAGSWDTVIDYLLYHDLIITKHKIDGMQISHKA